MDNVKRLEKFIKEKKWIKDEIGMGRKQLIKIMKVNNELILIIKLEASDKPVWARIARIFISDGSINLFYDGRCCKELEISEYGRFDQYLDEEEWDLLYEDNSIGKFQERNLISNLGGFYIDVHENIDNYNEVYDEKDFTSINRCLAYN